ncbi:NAD(P)/FAD-dependent oxidoreductase [Actinomycetospora sp. TBRC 11914]|uniref:NAD(P)/FAD-dependent oxidoreductase n=1 Tax=Actinomycetospora sp. TBRC 11914 TaxID=2729387 RepID=UPI00145F5CFC|nr:FAD-dependent oxidoreductase [Actinomycetospora sp. TBRC 11914]NMO93644.1 FAD-dependent oxidoreductase [Actinomycetospora sp. TBRC 11914]
MGDVDVVVCGAGTIGLAVASMLAREGHRVAVLEADPAPAPPAAPDAWTDWGRRGVAQFRQPHNVFPRFRHLCDEDLPGVSTELAAAGFRVLNLLDAAPPSLTDHAPRSGDVRLEMLTGRRPVLEAVLAAHAEEQPGVTVRRGVRVTGLTAGSSAIPGVPHVDGVVTAGGERWSADLVIDAMGRRTPSDAWLADLGTVPPLRVAEDSGYAYYTRYYRGPLPEWRIGAVTPHGTVNILTLPADNDTWSVTVFCGSRDEPLKALRDPACFDRVVRGFPLQQHWIDAEVEPGVAVIAGVLDQTRSLVVDGTPVVTGFTTVGDAWACTNPSAGRGISVGLMHAHLLRDVLAEHAGAPAEFAREFPTRAQVQVAPYVDHQLRADRVRVAEMDALRRGVPVPPRDPDQAAFLAAAMEDPEVFRALLETVMCLALPDEVLARPHVAAAVEARRGTAPDPPPGPDREELLALVAG